MTRPGLLIGLIAANVHKYVYKTQKQPVKGQGKATAEEKSRLATVSTSLNKFANSEVELRRVGGVNAPVGSRDQFAISCAARANHS